MCLDSRFENIYDTERSERLNDHIHVHNQFRTLCARVRGCVYTFLIFVLTGLNISNDGDKGVQICISPTFIEPSVYHRIKV